MDTEAFDTDEDGDSEKDPSLELSSAERDVFEFITISLRQERLQKIVLSGLDWASKVPIEMDLEGRLSFLNRARGRMMAVIDELETNRAELESLKSVVVEYRQLIEFDIRNSIVPPSVVPSVAPYEGLSEQLEPLESDVVPEVVRIEQGIVVNTLPAGSPFPQQHNAEMEPETEDQTETEETRVFDTRTISDLERPSESEEPSTESVEPPPEDLEPPAEKQDLAPDMAAFMEDEFDESEEQPPVDVEPLPEDVEPLPEDVEPPPEDLEAPLEKQDLASYMAESVEGGSIVGEAPVPSITELLEDVETDDSVKSQTAEEKSWQETIVDIDEDQDDPMMDEMMSELLGYGKSEGTQKTND